EEERGHQHEAEDQAETGMQTCQRLAEGVEHARLPQAMVDCTNEPSAASKAPPPSRPSQAHARLRRPDTAATHPTSHASGPRPLPRNSASWKSMPALHSSAVDAAIRPQANA